MDIVLSRTITTHHSRTSEWN